MKKLVIGKKSQTVNFRRGIANGYIGLDQALTWAVSAPTRALHSERIAWVRRYFPSNEKEINDVVLPDDAFSSLERTR